MLGIKCVDRRLKAKREAARSKEAGMVSDKLQEVQRMASRLSPRLLVLPLATPTNREAELARLATCLAC